MERGDRKRCLLVVLLLFGFVVNLSALSVTVNDNTECMYEYVLYQDDTVSGNFIVVDDHHVFWTSDHPADIDFTKKPRGVENHCSRFTCSTKQKEVDSRIELECEAALRHSFEELEAKNKVILLLEKRVKELEQKLQLVDGKSNEKVTNGDLNQVGREEKKEKEETALDGEFVKVENETLDVKDGSRIAETVSIADDKSSVIERSSHNSSASREFLEDQERSKELELELEILVGELKQSESENTQLKDEVLLTKEKLEESGKINEELELDHKKLQEQIMEAEKMYHLRLNVMQEALQAQEMKHGDLINVKEAFVGFNLELDSSRKKMEELEQELQTSTSEAQKFEELHKQSGPHAESETKRALEFEKLAELAKLSAKEMEDQMASLQEELKGLYKKIADNQKVEEALNCTAADLSTVQREIELKKSQMLDMQQKLSSKEAVIKELTLELDLKEDISALENHFSSRKEYLHAKVCVLKTIKLKLQEEESAKELVELVSVIQEELAKVIKEKEALEGAVADLTSNAAQMKEICNDLETKLKLSDENFSKAYFLLSQALANSAELEVKLKSLSRDSEMKLKEAIAKFTDSDSEAKLLHEKLKTPEDLVKTYEEQLAEESERSVSINEKLDQISVKLASSESTELKTKILEVEDKAAVSLSENELLVETNIQLKRKINELQELLHSDYAEKEATAMQLASHMNTIAEITDQRSRASELLVATEARISEAESQLQEAIQKFSHRDSEAIKLIEKLNALEGQIRMYEEQAKAQKIELELSLLKLKDLKNILQSKTSHFENVSEGLAEANLKLIQKRATYESKLNDLQAKLSSDFGEKDEANEQLHSPKKAIKDFTEQLTSEGKRLHSQLSSGVEENNLPDETYQNAKKSSKDSLKAEMDNVKAEIGEKAVSQNGVKKVEAASAQTSYFSLDTRTHITEVARNLALVSVIIWVITKFAMAW